VLSAAGGLPASASHTVRIVRPGPNGEEKTIGGEYREIIPEERIVFTWKHFDDKAWGNRTSVVTLELSDRDGGTELRLTHEQLPTETSRDDHNKGWKSVLDRLEKFVSK